MPKPSQFNFTHKELLELMIKQCDVHDGRWMLVCNFGFAAGNFGIGPEDAAPGGLLTVQSIGISRTDDPNIPAHLTLDAAEVNPT